MARSDGNTMDVIKRILDVLTSVWIYMHILALNLYGWAKQLIKHEIYAANMRIWNSDLFREESLKALSASITDWEC